MRRVVHGLVVGALLFGASPAAFATGLKVSSGYSSSSAPVLPSASGTVIKGTRGGLVHSVTLKCAVAPCEVALFDASTATDTGTPIWEGDSATANAVAHFPFPTPLFTENGIVAQVSGTGGGGNKAFVSYE